MTLRQVVTSKPGRAVKSALRPSSARSSPRCAAVAGFDGAAVGAWTTTGSGATADSGLIVARASMCWCTMHRVRTRFARTPRVVATEASALPGTAHGPATPALS